MAGLACGEPIHDHVGAGDGAGGRRLKADGRHPGRAPSQRRPGRPGQTETRVAIFSRLLRGGRMTKWKGQAASYAPNLAHLASAAAPVLRGALVSAALLAGLGAVPAGAADLYWDVNGTAVGLGGTGAWNTSSLFWNPSSDGVTGPMASWNNAAVGGDNAFFNGTAGTVTLAGPMTAHNLAFGVAGYTIAGSTLTLTGTTPTISIAGTTTISSVIAGSGFTKVGAGGLTLTGANTFTGDITVSAGALGLASDASLGAAGNGVSLANGTSIGSTSALAASRVVTIVSGRAVAGSGALTARFTGAGGLQVLGTISNDANDYTGQTVFGQGTNGFTSVADLGVASSLGAPTDAASGTVTVSAGGGVGGNLVYSGDGDSSNRNWRFNNTSSGGNYLQNLGTGTLTLTGGILAGGAYGLTMNFSAASGDMDLLGVISSSVARAIAFTGNAGRIITLGGANTYTGPTTINTITVKAATLANSGANSSFGTGNTINFGGGTLSYTGTGAATDRTLTISGSSTISNDGTGALSFSGPTSFVAGGVADTLTLGGSFAGANTFSGVISGAGNLTMNGAGTWVVSGSNTFTGTTTVQSGTLTAGSSAAFGPSNPLVVNGGTLDLGGFDITARSLAGTGGTVDLGSNNLTVNGTSGSATYAGVITGTGGLTKLGASTQTLTGANTYSGATSIGGGTLAVDFTAPGAPTNNIVSISSALNMSGGTLTVKGGTGMNSQSFNGLNVTAGNNRINATAGVGGVLTVNLGAVSRTGGLVDFGIGTGTSMATSNANGALGGWATVNGTDYAQVSSGFITAFTAYVDEDNAALWATGNILSDEAGNANTPYSGTVNGNVALGGLKYTAAANSTVTVGAGNTLGVDGTIIVSPSVGTANQTIQGGSLTGGAGGSALGVQQNSGGTFTVASNIINNGGATSFTVGGTGGSTGTGVVVLTGSNGYTGATTVSGATLAFNSVANGGVASAIGASSNASSNLVIENGTLRYTGATASTDRGFTLVNGGPSRTFEVTNAATNLTFSGQVTSPDDAGFIKTGAGTLTLTNASNDYVGATTIAGGTLAVGALANGGQASGIGAASNASSNLVLQNGGKLSYIGGTTSSDRGFTLGTGGGAIDVVGGTTLTMSGVGTGAGGLTKSGVGTLVLSGTNNYTGGTTVGAGILRAGSASAFGTGAMTVNTGATLDLAGNNNTVGGLGGGGSVLLGAATLTTNGNGSFSGTIGGSGGVAVAGGSQTFSGCTNSYTGATTITGTLNVSCLRNGGQPSDIGASSSASTNLQIDGTLNYTGASVTTDRGFTLTSGRITVENAATTLEFSGVATGTQLEKFGPGTLVLSGANTYNGATFVNGGTLRAGSTSAFGSSGLRMDTTGATLDLNGFSNTVGYISQGNLGITGGNITLGSATLTISGIGSANYNGAISGSGGLVKNGGSIQTLSGVASSYTGATTINGGVLAAASLTNGLSNSSIGASGSAPSNLVLNGGTLQYIGSGGSTDRQFTLGASGGGLDASGTGAINFTSTVPITLSGSGNRTLTLTGTSTANNSLSARIDNPASGTTALTKGGTGTWVLKNQTSTYTGITTISGGVLAVDKLADGGQASSIGKSSNLASSLAIGSGSTLRYTGTGDTTDRLFTLQTGVSFIESSGTGAIQFTNTGSALYSGAGARTLALGGTNTGLNIMGGTIVDQNATTAKTTLAKNDSGTWVLTGNNSYSGNTVINDGNLVVGNGGTSGNAGTGNVVVVNSTSTLSFNRSDTFNFGGNLSGAGNIAQIGAGTTRLTSVIDSSIGGTTRVDAGMLELATNLTSSGGTTVNAGTLQVDAGKVLTTPTLAMNGGSTLNVNGTVQAAGATPVTISGDAGASTINIANGGTLRGNGDLGGGSDNVNLTGTLNTGVGALNLGAGNDTLTLNDGAVLTGTVNAGTGGETGAGDTLRVINTVNRTVQGAGISGFESLDKQGTGTLTLVGDHSYSGGTTIQGGTLQVGSGATAGTLATPSVANNGTLAFNLNNNYSFGGAISGTGAVNKLGTGITTLTGNNSYSGATNVNAGTLLINGNQSGATGPTSVASGATLGGTGTIGGSVTVADGGTLAPGGAGNIPGTLTINGNLALGNSNLNVDFGQANVPGGPLNDLINVGGNLTLDGTLNVTQSPGGTLGPGVYRIINYNGTLADNGLTASDPDYFVQTSVANQVNLVNSAGLTLSYWDGNAGPASNGAVNGGSGTWLAAGDQNWTDITGTFAAPFANGSFAIFQGAAGTVTVDGTNGPVLAAGMQFATDGYLVQGADIGLVGPQSIIRVGDGTAAGAAYGATIASNLTGATQLVKTDLGTLVLGGTNTYTGGTAINGGTVQVASDDNLGDASGGLSLDGGTLHTTANVNSSRAVTLNTGGGTFDTDSATSLVLTNTVSGSGSLSKEGGGTLVLSGANSYQGGTVIDGGTVQIAADANLGDVAGDVTFDGGTLHVTGSGLTSARDATLNAGGGTIAVDNFVEWSGTIGGTGALTAGGPGFLALSGDNTYTGGTTIASGVLQLGNGGASGSILGDVVDNGNLGFDRSDTYSFDGLISGTGEVTQVGTGTTVLTADNTYAGTTSVFGGSLYIDGDQSAATGLTSVNAGTLGGNGIIGGDVSLGPGATLAPGSVGITPGTLTINGSLQQAGATLDYTFGQAGVVGGAYNDLTIVHGNLTLDGTINVTEAPGGNFGPGIYRVISYDGAFVDNGLTSNSPNRVVQTSVAGQVNLVDISAMTLNFWDGDAGPKANDGVDGGNGTWRAAGDDNWTGPDGDINAAFSNGSFAIFAGSAGTVTVDNTNGQVQAAGMQFATDGYIVQGQDIELVGAAATIRVGDGTLPGAGYTATIASNLTGASQLVKTDLGTLVLGGTNSYSGGTSIEGGRLQVSADANLGDAAGALSFDNGATLQNTAAFGSARDVTLNAGGGTFQTDADLTLSGPIGGAGGFTKTGGAALTLTGTNSYAGPTTVAAGGLYVDGDNSLATGLTSVGIGATLGGKGTIGGNVTVADGATLSPGSADGTPGTLAIAGDLTLSGGSILNYSFGQANVAGGALNDLTTVGGNLTLAGTLNVTVSPGGTFGPGIYRVFDYSGSLTNNGLSVGSIPSSNYFVQTSVDHQVNLVNTQGLNLNYWDGDAGPKFDGTINGGNGTWQSSSGNDNWTEDTGSINAAYSDGAFAIFAGQAGTVTVDIGLGQVTAAGMQFSTDGYVIQGGDIGLVGPQSTIRVGDGTSAGAGYTATIASALTGNAELIKTDAGTLVLTGANSYSGGTAINGGTLRVSADANLGDAAGGLSFNGGTLNTTASFASDRAVDILGQGTISTDAGTTLTLQGALAGSGAFNKAGDGTLVLTAAGSAFSGPTSVQQGTLAAGAADAFSSGSAFSVASGGTLDLAGFNQTVASLDNSGAVRLGAAAPGTVLTVTGDYVGNGGKVLINAALDGDASTTDRLVVHGSTSGTGVLAVTNVGGAGAQTSEGIKIVDIDGSSAGTFTLAGDYVFEGAQAVVGGAYAYRLYKNGVSTPADGDWYLRSTLINDTGPLYAPSTPLYEAYAGVLQSFNELGTLQQRIGNRTWGEGATPQGADVPGQGPVDGNAIWARIDAAHGKFEPKTSTTGTDYDVTTRKLNAGVDGLLHESEAGTLLGGITVHYGTVSSDVSSTFGAGSISATGYGLGGTLTWLGNSGFYVDTQAQATWYDSDINSAVLGKLADGNNGFGYALSVESGQKIALRSNWSLTPQAQLSCSAVDFDKFTDPFGTVVSPGSGDSLIGRLGISADYEDQWADSAGQVSRAHVYGIANLYYDFLDGTDVDVSGVKLSSQNQKFWGGVGLGGSLDFGDGKYSVYGEALAKTSLASFGDSNVISGKLGFSVRW
ncbi:autotransporter-associated beta strand repeat-containing protein [Mesorhizobium sp. B4-1-1]|uniref:autotransporter-associated beta strand repeat-containing protein n=1 Tax=Mesorhizobium sp. B4-1-1 TaxID=2589890 RepID=UPI00112DE62B|nr:autotransporter-associated beta strand repeat-containing protein [Mesorhizobium sp. B4-1-1]TPI21035.1 autotransporter outer membrane beta-barrel domain-containing protein [Mesorhizobium sp. B4-1-1]